ELKEVSLDEMSLYEAIFYFWGDPVMTRSIICSGSRLQVTVKLETALRHMRRSQAIRVLWADVISINQADPPGRSRQVQTMRNIHKRTKGVKVWIGESTRSSQTAL
ncbi:hypothetical protein AOQ84DRAFT_277412, partial [Glonium stellatum]